MRWSADTNDFGAPGMIKVNTAWFAHRERGRFAGIFGFTDVEFVSATIAWVSSRHVFRVSRLMER